MKNPLKLLTTMWNPPSPPKQLDISERIRRGQNCESLLRNELWKEAIEDLKRGYLQKWGNTAIEDVERREYTWLLCMALDDVNKRLHTWLTDGKLEADKLKAAREKRKERQYA